MDGTLPELHLLKIHSRGKAPITPRGWMGVDFLDHELFTLSKTEIIYPKNVGALVAMNFT